MVSLDTYSKNNRIEFENGSVIEFIVPEKSREIIRGRRSKLPMWLYDYECCNQEDIDKAIEPLIRKE